MSTIFNNVFSINGVVDTNQSVLDNMNAIASAAGAWVTYDVSQGKWAVIINTNGSSIASFNDNNIIGGINISSTGLNELYNSVEIEFPHKDLIDQRDYIRFDIDSSELYPNEPANNLAISLDLINDPVQAELIAARELKQSRIDKVINFKTDFTKIDLKAGDLIDVTSSQYDFSAKVYRVTKISEEDQDDGGLIIDITALEYSDTVYSTGGLTRTLRKPITIKPRTNNTDLDTKDDINTGSAILRLLGTTLVSNLLKAAFTKNPLTGKVSQILSPKDDTVENNLITAATGDKGVALRSLKRPSVIITGNSEICEGSTLSLSLALDCSDCLFDSMNYSYTITGVQADDITPFPLTGTVAVPGTMSIPIASDASVEGETLTLTIGSSVKTVNIRDALTFTYATSASPSSINRGSSTTVTLTTTGVANGTSVPYTITGDTSLVTTATSGTVTVNSNSATLTVNTTSGSGSVSNAQNFLVTFNNSQVDYCNQLDKTAAVTINGNATTCSVVSVPVVWCPTYDSSSGQVSALTAVSYAVVSANYSGGPSTTVPLTVSVTKGNPSTVTVLTSATIDASSNKGGQDFNVITTFNSIAPNALPTGTIATIRGYN